MSVVLISGSSGFIGYHLCKALLEKGHTVIGVDNYSPYYDVTLKIDRTGILTDYSKFNMELVNICGFKEMDDIFSHYLPDAVINLAAQAGVRHSIENPFAYQETNELGFLNILELTRKYKTKNFLFASSSSVYGGNTPPFKEDMNISRPISYYAATKVSNEASAHAYAHLYGIPTTGMRFFTVYGPMGRPDMALFKFTKAILENKPIDVYNHGKMKRNFTYIDDIIQGILVLLDNPVGYDVYNIGNDETVSLDTFIDAIEMAIGKKAVRNNMPMQPGDVEATEADISKIAALGYKPDMGIYGGVERFVRWYREYYKV